MLTNQQVLCMMMTHGLIFKLIGGLMIQRFEIFVNAITQIYRSIQKLKIQEMASFGLKGTHVMCLFQLQKHPEGLTSAKLTQLCEEDKAAISRALSQLQEKKLISFEEIPGQRRYRSLITLTPKGYEITSQMYEKIMNSVGVGAQGYNEEERETFYHVLLLITKNLQKAAEGETL